MYTAQICVTVFSENPIDKRERRQWIYSTLGELWTNQDLELTLAQRKEVAVGFIRAAVGISTTFDTGDNPSETEDNQNAEAVFAQSLDSLIEMKKNQ